MGAFDLTAQHRSFIALTLQAQHPVFLIRNRALELWVVPRNHFARCVFNGNIRCHAFVFDCPFSVAVAEGPFGVRIADVLKEDQLPTGSVRGEAAVGVLPAGDAGVMDTFLLASTTSCCADVARGMSPT